MNDRNRWNLTNLVATGVGAAGVVVLTLTGQIVLASSAAALTYLFVGPLRRREEDRP